MNKEYKKVSWSEILKDEILGLVFGFLAALLVAWLKKEPPGEIFYIIPAVFGLVSLIYNLLSNLGSFISIDQEKITQNQLNPLKRNIPRVVLRWNEIKEVNFDYTSFPRFRLRLELKGKDKTLQAENDMSHFKDFVKEALVRSYNASYSPKTLANLNKFMKDLIPMVAPLKTI